MSTRSTYIAIGVILQIGMVLGGHYNTAVLNLSAVLGMGIPFVLGGLFGRSAPGRADAAGGGFLIGIVGAFIGIVLAIVMGDQTLMLLTFGPLSSGITGIIGAVLVHTVARKNSQ